MEFDEIAIHIALAMTLFLMVNWVGSHSVSAGYISLNIFVRRDEAPAFNLLFRALAPIVFIAVVASIFYSIGLDRFVKNTWLVIFYYFAGRLLFNLILGRALLVSWWRESILWLLSIGGGWLLYDKVIQHKQTLLPDFQTITNELWVLIALFVYSTLNKVRLSPKATRRRKNRYLRSTYRRYRDRYHTVIAEIVPDKLCESLVYTILLYEGFNRPAAMRFLERACFPWMSNSLGPMQVQTSIRITDEESVKLGTQRVIESYNNALQTGATEAQRKNRTFDVMGSYSSRQYVVHKVATSYNTSNAYAEDIKELHSVVIQLIYPELEFKRD